MSSLYFDSAATTPPSFSSINAYNEALKYFENPSSAYDNAKKVKVLLEEARLRCASSLSLSKEEAHHLFFTSCATESNSIVLQSVIRNYKTGRVIITNGEHPSVKNNSFILKRCGFEVISLPSKNGFVNPLDLEKALTPNTVLVSIIYVNNVIGTKNDISSLASLVKNYAKSISKNITFHTDCVQAIGKTEFSLNEFTTSGVNAATFSSHKFYAPRGCGILYSNSDNIRALSEGGGQENGRRGGTENVAAIYAASIALEEEQKLIKNHIKTISLLKDEFLKKISTLPFITVLTPKENSVPSIISISLKKMPGEITVRSLSKSGISIGTTSACSANAKKNEKNILQDMGFSPSNAESAIRISFSPLNTIEDVNTLALELEKFYNTYK